MRVPTRLPVTVLAGAAIVVSSVVGLNAGDSAANTAPMTEARRPIPHRVAVYAHRGSSGSTPENTLAAVDFAVAQHADFVETDVRRTRDGRLVVMHDEGLGRTTDVEDVFPGRAPYRVRDFTLREIKRLDAGSWFSPQFAGERVPTLGEFVGRIGRRSGLLLEIKDLGVEQDIARELKRRPGYLTQAVAERKLIIQSFRVSSVRAIHKLLPEVPVAILYGVKPTDAALVEAASWADHINPRKDLTDRKLIDRVHDLGMRIAPYSLDTGQEMRKFLAMDVDGVITDNPGTLHDIETISR
ncbi:Glycerophosphodiester phosphodiesterase [Streptomyces sp. RB5]|uniref:Glycerophosphodiester phosphodiesterase n=1 Tax=Streptomyces smaragdinus TaxID=2585196 RepID=A0A7K0CK39_9ACTN|nr:glycerophosphodiester phosphodiesterase family protein [Streptomyces smaragdinus]MQY13857.1 Glycerophosphodiester phosphodiesterase [Streptomyces smaragdinus]